MGTRIRRVLAVGLAAWLVVACQSTSPGPATSASKPLVGKPRATVAPPPGTTEAELTPLKGDALAQAKLPTATIVGSLPVPDFLHTDDEVAPPATPPVAAQRAYSAGRQAWHEGRNFEAIAKLQAADRLAPDSPETARMLGRIYADTGNRVRAAAYLRQAIERDPTHLPDLWLLGRISLEQGDWQEAVVTLNRALELAEAADKPGGPLQPLIHYYLAVAVQRNGYAAAAIKHYEAHLAAPRGLRGNTPSDRALAFVDRQSAHTLTNLGDLHHRLNEPEEALEAYLAAAETQDVLPTPLVSRLVYTYLRLGQDEPAAALVIDQIRDTNGQPEAVSLIRYLADHNVDRNVLARRLHTAYDQESQPASLVIAIASLMDNADARALLSDHIARQPEDEAVFRKLIELTLAADEPEQAILATADVMAAAPKRADHYARACLEAFDSPEDAIAAGQKLSAAQRSRPGVAVVLGLAHATDGDTDQAVALLEQAAQHDDASVLARVELARILIFRKEYDRARRILDELEDQQDPRVVLLRVRVLTETEQLAEALVLVEQVISEGDASTAMIINRARLQIRLGKIDEAERALWDELNARPTEEAIYQVLFDLYNSGRAGRNATRQYQRLMRRVLSTIPRSRIARIELSKMHAARNEYDKAEQLLLGLLAEDADDLRALDQLLDVYRRSNRHDDGIALIEGRLEANPKDRGTLALARLFYRQIGDHDRLFAVTERILMLDDPGEVRAQSLASLYIEMGDHKKAAAVLQASVERDTLEKPGRTYALLWRALIPLGREAEAEQALRQAIEKYPQHADDLGYQLSVLVTRRGDRAGAERIMLDVLTRFPNHGPTNNGLGYTWATQNRNLHQAREMVTRAVETDPQNAAYLDSMGWVLYKLGEFKDAEAWLRKSLDATLRDAQRGFEVSATRAIVSDHLGDVLYRQGRQAAALRTWEQSKQHLSRVDASELDDDPELATLGERLEQKLEAARKGEPAGVAPLPPDEDEAPREQPEAEEEALGAQREQKAPAAGVARALPQV